MRKPSGPLTALLATSVFMIAGEWGARSWIEAHGNALDLTRRILRVDARLWWRQRADLDLGFLGKPLRTDERGWRTWQHPFSGGRKILFLGPSSTFGWGVGGEETYAAELERLAGASRPIVAINAGEIGYSSEQGFRLAESAEVESLHPDTVVIAYGVNDLDRDRFYFQSARSDEEEAAREVPATAVALANVIGSSSLTTLLYRFAGSIRGSLGFGTGSSERLIRPPDDPIPGIRVSKERFRHNSELLAQLFLKRGARVVFLSTAVRQPAPRPPDPRTLGLLEAVKRQWSQNDVSGARRSLQELLAADAGNCEAYYYLAASDRALGLKAEARSHQQEARNLEAARISRDVGRYNEELRSISDRQGIPFGDLDAWLGATSPREDLFVDPIHFSVEGNRKIARGLLSLLTSRQAI